MCALPIDSWVIVKPHGPSALVVALANDRIEVGEAGRVDCGLRGLAPLYQVEPALGLENGDWSAIARDRQPAAIGHIVRAFHAPYAVETVVVSGGFNRFAGRAEEHTSELQALTRTTYAVFRLKKT